MSVELTVLDEINDQLLDCAANELHRYLTGPTLFRLEGKRKEILFVSVLLHGNETTGWDAARQLLKKYQGELPRSLYLFVGNVAAAREGLRVLDGQSDYNRIWKDGDNLPETPVATRLFECISDVELFAAIDVHNNTGLNPHYACVNQLSSPFLHLATLFGRTVVYFIRPDSVMSMALSKYCPSVTVECGKPDDMAGTSHAMSFIDACLHLSSFPEHDVAEHDIDLFHTVATVKVLPDVDFAISDNSASLSFISDLDRLNFQELNAGTCIAYVKQSSASCLHVVNEQGDDVTDKYFYRDNDELRFLVPIMPSMLTLDEMVIRQDCLCYLMERMDYHNVISG